MKKEFEEILKTLNTWSHLGERTVANGAKLIGHIPYAGSEAYLHVTYAPLAEEKIAQIEQDIGIKLPETYKEFLRCSNGARLFKGYIGLYGLRKDFARIGDEGRQPWDIRTPNTFERPKDAEAEDIFIGASGNDADALYMKIGEEKVYSCERYHAKHILNEWPSLWVMLTTEIERLSKLFDENGKRKDDIE